MQFNRDKRKSQRRFRDINKESIHSKDLTMKFSTVLLTLGAASGAFAYGCTRGLTYCGTSLIKKGEQTSNLRLKNVLRGSDKPWTKGNYYTDILASLQRSDKPTSDDYILYSRFLCTADEDFLIWVDKCSDEACVDNGSGNDDTCEY